MTVNLEFCPEAVRMSPSIGHYSTIARGESRERSKAKIASVWKVTIQARFA